VRIEWICKRERTGGKAHSRLLWVCDCDCDLLREMYIWMCSSKYISAVDAQFFQGYEYTATTTVVYRDDVCFANVVKLDV
jgi:hypothetical protein